MTWLLLLVGWWGFAAPQPTPPSAAPVTLKVTLELAPDEGLLVNRLNPPEVSLRSPWKDSSFPAVVSGEPWAEHPDVYFERVNPVQWTLNIPAGTLPGRYEATVSAKLGLCQSDSGFCFVRRVAQPVALEVTKTHELPAAKVVMEFHAPNF